MGIGPLSGPGRASDTPTPPSPSPPVRTGNPFISSPTVIVGDTATAGHGAYSGTVSGYTGQWYRGTSAIALATGLTYQYQTADLGFSITYQELASNSAGFSAVGTSNALGPVATVLTTLTFSQTTFTVGTAVNGSINGATAGSTITATGLPASITINSVARTFRYDGTGSGSSGTITLTETLSVGSNSPHPSSVSYTINAATGTLTAPTLGYPSPQATNPTTITVTIGNDWQSGDILKLAYSSVETISSSTILTHTLIDADVTGGSITLGIPTLSSATYFQAFGSHSGADSSNLSNKVKWGDTTAPTITTSATQSQMELFPLAVSLTANETVSWAITGGADQSQFTLSGSTLKWFGNGTQNYDLPTDSDSNNTYAVQVSATDLGGNVANEAITVTVTAADKTPDTFTFSNVIPATPSTVYTSNTITVSGLTASLSVAASSTVQYSLNGGTSWNAAGSFTIANGGTITLKDTSGSGTTDVHVYTVVVGTYSTTWTVSNTANTAAWTASNGTSKNSNVTVSGSPALSLSTTDIPALELVRANAAASSKRYFEFTITSGTTGELAVGIDDGTTSFGPTTTAAFPGNATSTGLSFNNGSWGWEIKTASTVLFSDYASGTKALAVGDIIGFEFDTSAHTCQVWRKKSGTWTSLATVSTGFSLSAYYAFGGTAAASGVINGTANFGATAFDRTPSIGYIGYGS